MRARPHEAVTRLIFSARENGPSVTVGSAVGAENKNRREATGRKGAVADLVHLRSACCALRLGGYSIVAPGKTTGAGGTVDSTVSVASGGVGRGLGRGTFAADLTSLALMAGGGGA